MLKHTIFAVLIGLAVFFGYVAYYVGAFRDVQISEAKVDRFILLGKEHVGAYHKIVPVIQEVEAWAKKNNLDCSRSFGLYRMDPREAEEERLLSLGGCWVKESEVNRLAPFGPDSSQKLSLPVGFKIETWQAPAFVKAIFEGAPGVGPLKVYPKVEEYIEEKRLKRLSGTLEIYVMGSGDKEMTTTYYFPIEPSPEAARK